MEFTLKRQEIIVPSPLSSPHVVTLSNIDQIVPSVYTCSLYFFPLPSTPPLSTSLTQSLARALAAFPPAAGRLKSRSNGAGMDVECHNQGAVFVEAHATTTLHHLLTTGNGGLQSRMYQQSPLWKSLAPNPYEEESTDKPLLFVQLTRLGCGGVVVAVAFHHLVADGAAQAHFMASWAALAHGEPITAHPHLDRTCIQARTPPCPSFEHQEYIVHKTVPLTSFFYVDKKLPPVTSQIFEFLPQDIQVLKERVSAEGDVFTGFQALVAHIWKHVTKARGLEASQQTNLGWVVDGRKRFNPPLPPNYFGNVLFYGFTEERAGEVTTQPVHHTAMLIRSATQRITDEYMRSALDLIAAQASPALVSASFKNHADLMVTSWVQFKAYDMNWGWGPPHFFAPLSFIPTAGYVILLPHANGHAINALIFLFQPHMDALLSDIQFYPIR